MLAPAWVLTCTSKENLNSETCTEASAPTSRFSDGLTIRLRLCAMVAQVLCGGGRSECEQSEESRCSEERLTMHGRTPLRRSGARACGNRRPRRRALPLCCQRCRCCHLLAYARPDTSRRRLRLRIWSADAVHVPTAVVMLGRQAVAIVSAIGIFPTVAGSIDCRRPLLMEDSRIRMGVYAMGTAILAQRHCGTGARQ